MKRTGHVPLDYDRAVVDDDDSPFFAVGRELESSSTTHRYTEQEKRLLNCHQAIDYFPPNSEAYRKSLNSRPRQNTRARWLMMALIGVCVGSMAYFVKNTVEVLIEVRTEAVTHMLLEGHVFPAWAWVAGYSTGLATLAAAIVVLLRPAAAGSGIPEVIAFLNGTHLPSIFNLKTFTAKFVSLILALGAGLPLGPEGPMIHMGGMIGAGLSQGRSRTLGFSLYRGFRDSRDKRDFISAGVAAGVSAAFGAPVGGTLFAFEEVASFWNQALGWQIFFCSMTSVVTLNFWQSGFHGFAFHSSIGEFQTSAAVLFVVTQQIPANIIAFAPTIVIAVLSGTVGALFTFFNLKMVRFRRRYINGSKLRRILEVSLIMLLYATATIVIPMAFGCRTVDCTTAEGANSAACKFERVEESAHDSGDLMPFTCDAGHHHRSEHSASGNTTIVYNEAASLFLVNSEEAIVRLFSRRTPRQFGYGSLLSLLVVYFPLSCWATGCAASSGIEPLLIGTLVGRICGLVMVDLFGTFPTGYWSWIDPGAFALVGAAAFFAGVSRLTMSLTVIMIEITNDINFLLPIMTAVMVAKWVADSATHSLYHALIEIKCLPFLDGDVSSSLHLDAVNVGHAMQSPVRCVPELVRVHDLARLLLETEHNGYPIVRPFAKPAPAAAHRVGVAGARFSPLQAEVEPSSAAAADGTPPDAAAGATLPGDGNDLSAAAFVGIVSRDAALALLRRPELYVAASAADVPWLEQRPDRRPVDREMRFVAAPRHGPLTTLRHPDLVPPFTRRNDEATTAALRESLRAVLEHGGFRDRVVDLRPVVDESAFVVPFCFSLERAYIIFRSMGLRHLVITDESNGVAGIVTRFDLMGFRIKERIAAATNDTTWNRNPAQGGIEMKGAGADQP